MPITRAVFAAYLVEAGVFDTHAIMDHFGVSARAVSHMWTNIMREPLPEEATTVYDVHRAILIAIPPVRVNRRGTPTTYGSVVPGVTVE